jgi:hypothetical protein
MLFSRGLTSVTANRSNQAMFVEAWDSLVADSGRAWNTARFSSNIYPLDPGHCSGARVDVDGAGPFGLERFLCQDLMVLWGQNSRSAA